MTNNNLLPTIVALATPHGQGAIHIIRVSGTKAYQIVNQITTNVVTKKNKAVQLTNIIDQSNNIIDQVLLIKFVAPHSFTGEDLIEINCHGSMFLVRTILELLVKNGASLAQAGDFSKRAFLANKLDLNQATAILALIDAKSQNQVHTAMANLDGRVSNMVSQFSDQLFHIIAECEINIDFPEVDNNHEIDDQKLRFKIKPQLTNLIVKLKQFFKQSQAQKINNYRIVIVGRANAGKSSLLNAILQSDRVIVSDVAGTTRDSVEVEHYFQGKLFSFVDTAGINDTTDQIEKMGIDRTHKEINHADLIIHLIDSTCLNHQEDEIIKQTIKNKNVLTVYSKKDLVEQPLLTNNIYISAINNDLIDLYQAMEHFFEQQKDHSASFFGLCNDLSVQHLALALSELEEGFNGLINNLPIDLILENLHLAYDYLLKITNEIEADMINKIFANFCVGK
ncbi:tRNA uridine-5-carboxymethylaminomethyl(34) synthesis GTPase MnmE / tRNA modification GTPase TrmE [[Mycoplasma] cavipharyngis]|uniref:tRNA uridine-5-carboxymethylaminomethyl(34) synthesis GTPase MnmE n=1 Tax=[Mycoplasma] cavipharyngis TaxID=92757 RepID=UPI003703CDE3